MILAAMIGLIAIPLISGLAFSPLIVGIGAICWSACCLAVAIPIFQALKVKDNAEPRLDQKAPYESTPKPSIWTSLFDDSDELDEEDEEFTVGIIEEQKRQLVFEKAQQQLKDFLMSDKALWDLFSETIRTKKELISPPQSCPHPQDFQGVLLEKYINQSQYTFKLKSEIEKLISFIENYPFLRIAFCNHLRATQNQHPEQINLIEPFCQEILESTTPEYEAKAKAFKNGRWRLRKQDVNQAMLQIVKVNKSKEISPNE